MVQDICVGAASRLVSDHGQGRSVDCQIGKYVTLIKNVVGIRSLVYRYRVRLEKVEFYRIGL